MILLSKNRYQSRAKRFQKMKRGALVEQNQVSGEEKRISQRLTDISFERERPAEQEAGRRAVQRAESSAGDGKKRRKLSRIVQQTAEEAVWASTPEPTEPITSEKNYRKASGIVIK